MIRADRKPGAVVTVRLLLLRHAPTRETGPKLTGRTPGVSLSEAGAKQAAELGQYLARAPIKRIFSSPMERTQETAAAVASHHRLRPVVVEGLNEVDYGQWAGKTFTVIRRSKIWPLVFSAPSRVRFPGGESLSEAQARGIAAVDEIVAASRHGLIAAVTHADIIRLVLAHYLGVHLDLYQRIQIAPASISVVDFGEKGPPHVHVMNASPGDPAWLKEPEEPRKKS